MNINCESLARESPCPHQLCGPGFPLTLVNRLAAADPAQVTKKSTSSKKAQKKPAKTGIQVTHSKQQPGGPGNCSLAFN